MSRIQVIQYRISIILGRGGEYHNIKPLFHLLQKLLQIRSTIHLHFHLLPSHGVIEEHLEIKGSTSILLAMDQCLIHIEYQHFLMCSLDEGRQLDTLLVELGRRRQLTLILPQLLDFPELEELQDILLLETTQTSLFLYFARHVLVTEVSQTLQLQPLPQLQQTLFQTLSIVNYMQLGTRNSNSTTRVVLGQEPFRSLYLFMSLLITVHG